MYITCKLKINKHNINNKINKTLITPETQIRLFSRAGKPNLKQRGFFSEQNLTDNLSNISKKELILDIKDVYHR